MTRLRRQKGRRVAPDRPRPPRLSDEEWAAYQAHPQNWLATQEFLALVRILETREPSLLAWFARKRNGLLMELRGKLSKNVELFQTRTSLRGLLRL